MPFYLSVLLNFQGSTHHFSVGSFSKLCLALDKNELQMAILLLPMHKLSYYLTDRVSNYEELKPYFSLLNGRAFIIIGFDAEAYGPQFPLLPKGKDGMSDRSIHRWKDR